MESQYINIDVINGYCIISVFLVSIGLICAKSCNKEKERFEIIKWKNNETLNDTCCICLEEYKINEKISVLKCSHNFHKKCLESWLYQSNTCPLCVEDIEEH